MPADITTTEGTAAREARRRSPATPAELFRGLTGRSRVAFLDGRAGLARAPHSVVAWDPRSELRIGPDGRARVDGAPYPGADPLDVLDGFVTAESALGRTVIGALAYDLGRWIEPRVSRRSDLTLPLAVLSSYEQVANFDHARARWTVPPPLVRHAPGGTCEVGSFHPETSEAGYAALFERARRWIAAGDVYQVNLSVAFEANLRGDPAALYERLASRHPVPFGAYLDCGDFHLLSNSPELFLERRGARIATRPIKGTRRRGRTHDEDARLREELRHDVKERAEHVMIVDLERNDLGRIAEPGSVRVEELETVETYSSLHHLESTVHARLRPALRFSEILRATFPGGSITGAPKIRAMQVIDEIESGPREFYTGALLVHPPDGNFTMSIAIRTATVVDGTIRYRAGGGVVWDSVAEAEYRECLLKTQAFLDAASPL